MKRFLIIFLACGTFMPKLFAQLDLSNELTIGQRCPDFYFACSLNTNKGSFHLSDFRHKLVILDFWETWCAPCVSALPHLDSLEKQFVGKIEILPITDQRKETVSALLNKNKYLKNLMLKFITDDTIMRLKYFPARLVPHEIWIDGNGIVLSITSGEEVTANNIQKFLNGKMPQLLQKKDIIEYDLHQPLLSGALKNYSVDKKNIVTVRV
jgi:thiol-disulfide isomerase/thioredoxin